MRNFKFFQNNKTILVEERARLLREFLGDEDAVEPVEPYHSESPQTYTQILRMNVPINEMTEDHLNHLKISQERVLMDYLSNTLDFRHEIISVDGNGFTLRTELYI